MSPIFWIPALVTVLVAAVIDGHSRRIPNWLSLPSLLLAFVLNIATSGFAGLRQGVLGFGLALLFFGVQCWWGNMGMGDLKLGCAIGSWIGPAPLAFALVVTAMAGGVLAVSYSLLYKNLPSTLEKAGTLLTSIPDRRLLAAQPSVTQSIPYAPAMAIGVIVSMFAYWR